MTINRERKMVFNIPIETPFSTYTQEIFLDIFSCNSKFLYIIELKKCPELCTQLYKLYVIWFSAVGDCSIRYRVLYVDFKDMVTCSWFMLQHYGKICRHTVKYILHKSCLKILDHFDLSNMRYLCK